MVDCVQLCRSQGDRNDADAQRFDRRRVGLDRNAVLTCQRMSRDDGEWRVGEVSNRTEVLSDTSQVSGRTNHDDGRVIDRAVCDPLLIRAAVEGRRYLAHLVRSDLSPLDRVLRHGHATEFVVRQTVDSDGDDLALSAPWRGT